MAASEDEKTAVTTLLLHHTHKHKTSWINLSLHQLFFFFTVIIKKAQFSGWTDLKQSIPFFSSVRFWTPEQTKKHHQVKVKKKQPEHPGEKLLYQKEYGEYGGKYT